MLYFKDKLIDLRKMYNLTQDDLAKKINVSRSTISNYESGIRRPSMDAVNDIAEVFHVNVSDLVDEKEHFIEIYEKLKDNIGINKFIDKFNKLDDIDKARIDERLDTLLEADKYKGDDL